MQQCSIDESATQPLIAEIVVFLFKIVGICMVHVLSPNVVKGQTEKKNQSTPASMQFHVCICCIWTVIFLNIEIVMRAHWLQCAKWAAAFSNWKYIKDKSQSKMTEGKID